MAAKRLIPFLHKNVLPPLNGHSAAYVYSWPDYVDEVLPQFYKDRCIEFLTANPRHIYMIPKEEKWRYDFSQQMFKPVQNIHVNIFYPDECNHGLWGGEGVVKGYTKKVTGKKRLDKFALRRPRLFTPHLMHKPVYSEIMDQWWNVTVTSTTLHDINNNLGFDYYILQTSERDLNSRLGMKIKRLLLETLAKEELLPKDPEKRAYIMKRYQKFIMPLEEVAYMGLTAEEAYNKALGAIEAQNPIRPLKEKLAEDYIKYLSMTKTYKAADAKK